MARVRKLIMIVLVILLILIALVFSLNNRSTVALDFLIYQTPELGVAVWLIGALTLGAVLGLAVGSLAAARSGLGRRKLERKLEHTERALERQRSESAKAL